MGLIRNFNGVKIVGCKWVYKTKYDSKENVERYKARLLAKCFMQREWIDYNDSFLSSLMQGFFYNHNGVNGTLWFRVTLDGCKDDIPQRGFIWKRLHGTTQKVLSWKKRTYVMPPVEIHLWAKCMSLDISIEVDENNKKV